ncbi:hypothetical protein Cs7R123_06610 [Catellatospora sp. TT07R-123]|uniref:VIT1/CCC1 transporter family protein n=1 Tax=Catellatospora sp. TT07R-123 TaxID=2733863 RepID=UPI001B24309F|nr:VIT1/CCC1 transporter family protein [Catellatospora sp. TT07R-123]GHJ43319.1 hypothetical protein Cs7R123_06610 [Catellatospora sp. TT07R-123]
MSVSSQCDTERALLAKERAELGEFPEQELDELTGLYEAKRLRPAAARQVALELTAVDTFAAHTEVELGISAHDLANPWHAAGSSALAFTGVRCCRWPRSCCLRRASASRSPSRSCWPA